MESTESRSAGIMIKEGNFSSEHREKTKFDFQNTPEFRDSSTQNVTLRYGEEGEKEMWREEGEKERGMEGKKKREGGRGRRRIRKRQKKKEEVGGEEKGKGREEGEGGR